MDMLGRMAGAAMGSSGGKLNISVCDPVKQDQGAINAYITYKVNTSTDRPDFQYGQFSVIRRYNDFVWLSERLAEEFPGAINPPLPEKHVIGINRFEPEFIERRRKELERYLARVAAHEELSTSQYFMTFLQADDAALAEKKEDDKKSRTSGDATPAARISRWFEEAVTVVKTHVGKDDDSSKTEVDKRFDNIQAYINELDVQIQQVAKHASNLVKKQEALGSTMYDFGFAFTQLAGAEKDTVPLGQALQHMGEKADSVSVAYKAQALKEGESFEGPINEYVKIIGALKQAMSKRQDKKITYMTAAHEVEQRNLAHQKLQGVTGKEDKLRQAEEQLHNAKATLDAAKADFEKVTRRVLKEFERFRQEKARDLKQIMLDYVNIQVEYTRKQEASWTELIPQLEAMEVEGSGNMYTSKTGGAQSRASDQMVGV